MDGVNLGKAPRGATADYHTHGAFDPRYNNENFSGADTRGNTQMNINGYLGTPAGNFLGNINGNISKVRGQACSL